MTRQIFVNLPIRDMQRSRAFFESLGFAFNPQFTNEQGACMVVSDNHNYVMLLVEPFFQTFTQKKIADATRIRERVTLVTRKLADGHLIYMIFITPDEDAARFNPALNAMVQSLRVSDTGRH